MTVRAEVAGSPEEAGSAADRMGGRVVLKAIGPGIDGLVRIAPSRLVWWHGWSSGSALAS